MKGQALWDELERRGREKYKLDDSWHLSAVDISDSEIAEIKFNQKGSRGGWIHSPRVKGAVIWTDLNEITHLKG